MTTRIALALFTLAIIPPVAAQAPAAPQAVPTATTAPDCLGDWYGRLTRAIPVEGPVTDAARIRELVVESAACRDTSVLLSVGHWLDEFAARLQPDDVESLVRLVVTAAPKDDATFARFEERERAKLWWERRATQEERRAFYWRAVREGRVLLWDAVREGDRRLWSDAWLVRQEALVNAALEGMVEFIPAMDQNAAELDQRRNIESCSSTSKCWILRARLREGAKDRNDGDVVEARRLSEMRDQEFYDRMESETVFREVVVQFATQRCLASREVCSRLSEIAERQQKLFEETRGDTAKSSHELGTQIGQKSPGAEHWLTSLLDATETVRARGLPPAESPQER